MVIYWNPRFLIAQSLWKISRSWDVASSSTPVSHLHHHPRGAGALPQQRCHISILSLTPAGRNQLYFFQPLIHARTHSPPSHLSVKSRGLIPRLVRRPHHLLQFSPGNAPSHRLLSKRNSVLIIAAVIWK